MSLSVLIPYASEPWRDVLFDWLLKRYAALLPEAEICIGESTPFNRSAARNDAYRKSSGDFLLIADADTIFHREQICDGIWKLWQQKTWVIPYGDKNYYNLTKERTDVILKEDPSADIQKPWNSAQYEHKLESWAGLLLVPRVAYDVVGGYDERFRDWGMEDNAFRLSLDTLWGHHVRVKGNAQHLWHPAPEEVRFQQPHIEYNRSLLRKYQRAFGDVKRMKELIDR